MSFYASVFLFWNILTVLLTPLVFAATTAARSTPPPIIRTLGVADVGPEFKPIGSGDTETQGNLVEDAQYWHRVGMKQLEKTIKLNKDNKHRQKAKNIIIFIGDGMGMSTITAGRIYKGQYLKLGPGEDTQLAFDDFPYTGLSKTYNVDKQVPDSAATATAMFTGSKTHYGAVGMDITRSKTNGKQGQLESIMDWAQAVGKRTGVVTTTRITHATPSSTYARIYHRDWECDSEVPDIAVGHHVDIARQLVERAPGNKLNVIMGGGLKPMGAPNLEEKKTVKFEGDTEIICGRNDGRNLPNEWLQMGGANDTRRLVKTRADLLALPLDKIDHLMGLFRNNHITYSIAREEGEPTLQEMTESAIRVLERGPKSAGYMLLVEGGRIDQAHHQNYAHAALREVFEMDLAVQAAVEQTNPEETLIIVTADHSHAVTLNGYPLRGEDILGAGNLHEKEDPMIYETITYANGPGYYDHLANETQLANGTIFWRPLTDYTTEERQAPTYRHLAALPLDDETHGGEDVVVFANGPGASLIRGVFEQNYLAYVMSYAGCMGPAKNFDDSCSVKSSKNSANSPTLSSMSLFLIFIGVFSYLYL